MLKTSVDFSRKKFSRPNTPESRLETHKAVVKNFFNESAKTEAIKCHEIVVAIKVVVEEQIVDVEKREKKRKGKQVGNPGSGLKEVVKKEKHEKAGNCF